MTIWICYLHKHLLTVRHYPYLQYTVAIHVTKDTSLHTQLKADHPENAFAVITTAFWVLCLTRTWCVSYEQYAFPQLKCAVLDYILIYLQMTRTRVNHVPENMKTSTKFCHNLLMKCGHWCDKCTPNTTQYICMYVGCSIIYLPKPERRQWADWNKSVHVGTCVELSHMQPQLSAILTVGVTTYQVSLCVSSQQACCSFMTTRQCTCLQNLKPPFSNVDSNS